MKQIKLKKKKPASLDLSWDWQDLLVDKRRAIDIHKAAPGKLYNLKKIKEVIGTVDGSWHGVAWIGLFKTTDNKFLFVKAFASMNKSTNEFYVANTLPPLISTVFKKPDKSRLFNAINNYLS